MPAARPACLITGTVSPYRREPFRLLAEAEGVEVLAYEDPGPPVPGLTVRATSQRGTVRLVASGRYRAVICGLGGRLALPGSYLAARARGLPFVLWATIWEHPSTLAHRLSRLPTDHLYRHADAVATYGEHVSRHVATHRGARGDVYVAPQAVDIEHFAAPVPASDREAARAEAGVESGAPLFLFAGRLEREKGLETLLAAWRAAELPAGAVLALAGDGPLRSLAAEAADKPVRALGHLTRERLRALYAAADVLVLPSIRTATFTEPWGLVVNEAMLQSTPTIASDAVGAAAGGLVRDGRNGLVFPAGDTTALATRLSALAGAPELRERLGAAAREDAAKLTPAAWADGMAAALRAASARSAGR